MSHNTNPVGEAPAQVAGPDLLSREVGRRSFLRYTGATAVVGGLVLAGCKKDDDDPVVDPNANLTKTLTNNDTGILNYAYALEQLEAAFYQEVVANHSAVFTAAGELDTFKQIRDHEIIHREFFKAALGTSRLISLTFDFTTIDFTTRAGILSAARLFEDTGVQAYNGAGPLITSPDYLVLAGKIVSVEARHAALLRDMIAPNSFAAKVAMGSVPAALNANGTDMSKKPSVILAAVLPFIKERATLINQLP